MWRHRSRDHSARHRPYLTIDDPLEQSLYLQPFSRYLSLSVLGSRPWPFRFTWRHRSRDHLNLRWPFPIGAPLSPSLSPAVSEILDPKHVGVTTLTLTFRGHVTSSVTWPFDSQVAISYRHSIVTKSLSPAIFEVMGIEHIGVMTLTFRVTWRHRSRDYWTWDRSFPIGGPLDPSLYLKGFRDIPP